MFKSISFSDVITLSYGLIALEKFADAMTFLSAESKTDLSNYADTAQAFLIVLCQDLEENLDIKDCLSIIHNVYMYVASHNEKYREEIGDIIKGIARKEKEPNE